MGEAFPVVRECCRCLAIFDVESFGIFEELENGDFNGQGRGVPCRGQLAVIGEVIGNQFVVFCPTFLAFVLPQIEHFALQDTNWLSGGLMKAVGWDVFLWHLDAPFE